MKTHNPVSPHDLYENPLISRYASEEMSRIWTLFPTANFRTSVVYLAYPVLIDPALVRTVGPPVIREPHRAGHFEKGAA